MQDNIGQEFAGDGLEYFTGSDSLLQSATTGNAFSMIVKAFPTGFTAGKNYLLESHSDSKFISIYCDGNNGNEFRADWYPNGAITTFSSGITCPTNGKIIVMR